eukprot:Pgem_evm1s12438
MVSVGRFSLKKTVFALVILIFFAILFHNVEIKRVPQSQSSTNTDNTLQNIIDNHKNKNIVNDNNPDNHENKNQ